MPLNSSVDAITRCQSASGRDDAQLDACFGVARQQVAELADLERLDRLARDPVAGRALVGSNVSGGSR